MKNILIAILFLPSLVFAQPGTLDRSFGDTGVVISTTYTGYGSSVAIQSDGKIVAFGTGGYDSTGGFLIARYDTDGSLDNSFGNEGRVVTSFAGTETLVAGAIQHDGNIVVCGKTLIESTKVAPTLVRYHSDGSTDSSFGINGIVQTRIKNNTQAVDMAIQPDGKIVVGGWIINADNEPRQGFLVRYMPDGSLDESFADQGILIFDQVTYSIRQLNTIALQQDGKILIAGNSVPSGQGLIYRFNADGSKDMSFGYKGQAAPGITSGVTLADLQVQPDGPILIGAATNDMAVVRLLPNGLADSSFGINGLAFAKFGEDASDCRAVLLQPDGKIITAGSKFNGDTFTEGAFAIARFSDSGVIDSSFGTNGIASTSLQVNPRCYAAVLQEDAKIVLGGYTFTENPFFYHFVLARYNNDAALPLQFIYFNAAATSNGGIVLNWQTAQENNNDYFVVERSADSRFRGNDVNGGSGNDGEFEIARVPSNEQQGTSNEKQNYSYTDNTPLQGANFYRLKQVDKDGKFSYSQIVSATIQNGLSVVLYPNPVKDVLNIKGLDVNINYELLIMNAKGGAVASTKINNTSNYKWNLQSLSKGVYYLNIISNQKTTTVKFVKE